MLMKRKNGINVIAKPGQWQPISTMPTVRTPWGVKRTGSMDWGSQLKAKEMTAKEESVVAGNEMQKTIASRKLGDIAMKTRIATTSTQKPKPGTMTTMPKK